MPTNNINRNFIMKNKEGNWSALKGLPMLASLRMGYISFPFKMKVMLALLYVESLK